MTDEAALYSIDELAAAAGVARRTVRYYVQRGLLPPPTGLGRGRHYTASHLARLVSVRDQQAAGVSLETMLSGRTDEVRELAVVPPREPAACAQWARYVLADGVELHVRAGALSPRVEAALREAGTAIIEGGGT